MWTSLVKYQDPRTKTFLGTPSILRLSDGALLATHDYFGPGCPRDQEGKEHLTSVYRSEDDGHTWHNVRHLSGAYWSGLFVHRGGLYLMGVSATSGNIVIRRSDDGGYSWTHPIDEKSGLLFRGGPGEEAPNYHCSAVPVVEHAGRIWRAFEDVNPPRWPMFRSLVVSAPADADLLDAGNWSMTNKLVYDRETDPPELGGESGGVGWLEGNVAVDPEGRLWNVLRLSSPPVTDVAAMVRVVDEHTAAFDPKDGFIRFPGAASKFTIRRDPESGLYWSIVTDMSHRPGRHCRDRLHLSASSDLRNWELCGMLLRDNLESEPENSVKNTGFQYVDWQFDGDDIIYLTRTGYDGADNFHNANRITFGRIRDFRLMARK